MAWREALDGHPRTPAGAEKVYDLWAHEYDTSAASWGYRVPDIMGRMLAKVRLPSRPRQALDLGCGTGLPGAALVRAGVLRRGCIDGCDISERSLEVARSKGVYGELRKVDICQSALPFKSAHYGLVTFVSVMSYIANRRAAIEEAMRIAGEGGVVAFTHRTDRFADPADGVAGALADLTRSGHAKVLDRADNVPYYRLSPGYEDVTVIVVVLRVLQVPARARL
eukprot:TRINITY_DN47823_c0_g1_i1.p1 TRINITY_DN47823_c0_g1~~TRINITY_DN47823_c0_g1_i1.p1  ORF type:complete len:239 (+),score=63.36 TRINITY_DN47823_c0_g1_i1:48-719(+)